jgi:hypothetical protein
VLVTKYNGSTWTAFLNTGGHATSNPDCADFDKSGEVVCFARGTDTGLWGIVYDGGTWSTASWTPWSSLGGVVGQASCALVSSGELVCAAIGINQPNSPLYVDEYSGSSWSGWTLRGSTGIGAPSCANLETGKAVCVFVGANNEGQSVTGP